MNNRPVFVLAAAGLLLTGCGTSKDAAPGGAGAVPSAAPSHAPRGTWYQSREIRAVGYHEGWQVHAVGTKDAWAFHRDMTGSAIHWDGRSWAPAARPPGMEQPSIIRGSGPGNVWFFENRPSEGPGGSHLLAWRWDGKQWGATHSTPIRGQAIARTAAVLSANDVWVSGDGLLKHWDGTRWTDITAPKPIAAFAPVSARDIWAVDQPWRDSEHDSNAQATIMHWDGVGWRAVRTPRIPLPPKTRSSVAKSHWHKPQVMLNDILALSQNDVWAVGAVVTPMCCTERIYHRTVVLHWDGRSWTDATYRVPGVELTHVVPDGRGGLWMTAYGYTDASFFVRHGGGRWTRVELPSLRGRTNPQLLSLTNAPGSTTVWAAAHASGARSGEQEDFGIVLAYSD